MELRPLDALQVFVDQIPERLVNEAQSANLEFDISRKGELLSAVCAGSDATKTDIEVEFDPHTSALQRCACTCQAGRKGTVCMHVTALVLQLIDELVPSLPGDPLDYLDKYLTPATLTGSNLRLVVQISEERHQLSPEVYVERLSGDGQFVRARRFTANDSYKMSQASPQDQNLLEYLKNFRQVVFYSSYPMAKKFPWGFWLSLLHHPRVYWGESPVQVLRGELALRFEEHDGSFHLKVAPLELGTAATSVFVVEGGLLFFDSAENRLLVAQVDPMRLGIVRDTLEANPVLSRVELMQNVQRLERLRSLFEFEMPKEVDEAITTVEPELVLQMELTSKDGLVLRPRVRYEGVSNRVVIADDPLYLVTAEGGLIRRNGDSEQALLERFLEDLPNEFGAIRDGQIAVLDLDLAFSALAWLREQDSWELEWLKSQPQVTKLGADPRLRLHTDTRGFLRIFLTTDDKEFELDPDMFSEREALTRNFVVVGDSEWLQIDAELRSQLTRLKFALQTTGTKVKLKNAAIPMLSNLEGIEWSGKRDFKDKVDQWRLSGGGDHQPSESLNADLRGYQLDGYRWLRRMADLEIGVCLADDMGLGKTIQALAVLLDRVDLGPVMIVAPASVVFNWRDEIERFAPTLNPVIYAQSGRSKRLGRLKKGDILILSYALLLRDIDILCTRVWGTLVLDEAQFIKNALSQTAQAATQLKRKWTLALTGTPLENHLGELWSIFRMVDPAILGDWSSFRQNFINPIEKSRDRERLEALRMMITPFIMRRTKSEVLDDLPERTEIVLRVEMNEQQRARYLEERNRILRQVDANSDNLRLRLLTGILRLRQLSCHPFLVDDRYKGESSKLTLFSQLVQEMVSESHRALVFSQFTSFLDLISKELNRIRIPYLTMTGETPVRYRHQLIKRFQDGEAPIFLISLRAGGTGINLTHANYVFHMDPWWNPAVEEQATDRAHRIGQTEPLTVYRLIAKESIEEAILQIHDRKKEIVDGLLAGHDQPGQLSVEDLIALIQGVK